MNAIGVVREYHPEQGWGVIDADTVPGGCWVHFSTLDVPGHRALTRGEVVSFVAEPAGRAATPTARSASGGAPASRPAASRRPRSRTAAS
ncbi:hypothetical protein AB0883_03000 [Micromonospora sp. NPDC047812]|uniref:hypothetical protein n=1 Tax=Micromonospora sp. NPDC047812 TaxID=3155742 RepID=UPI0034553C15